MAEMGPGMRKLLIVDDDTAFRELVTTVAHELDYTVMGIGDGTEVDKTELAFRPDVILIDMVMPQIDGIEVLRKLLDRDVDARMIFVTGHSPTFLKAAEALATANGLERIETIAKPFELAELRRVLA